MKVAYFGECDNLAEDILKRRIIKSISSVVDHENATIKTANNGRIFKMFFLL